jgi:hypothetical protein
MTLLYHARIPRTSFTSYASATRFAYGGTGYSPTRVALEKNGRWTIKVISEKMVKLARGSIAARKIFCAYGLKILSQQ